MIKRDCYSAIVDRIVGALGITKVEFGKNIGVSKTVVNSWRITGIPPKYCPIIEMMLKSTSDPMTKIEMRPFDWEEKFPEIKFHDDRDNKKGELEKVA